MLSRQPLCLREKASPTRKRGDADSGSIPRLVSGLGPRLFLVCCEILIIFCHIIDTLTAINRTMGQLRPERQP